MWRALRNGMTRALPAAAIVTAGVVSGGCSTSGETVAVTAASAAGAALIGAQLGTHSEIDVEVEVFNESAAPPVGDPSHFRQTRPLAVSRLVSGGLIDPSLQPSKGAFLQVAQKVQPIMDGVGATRSRLEESIENLSGDRLKPSIRDRLAPIAEDLRGLRDRSGEALAAWEAFRAELRNASGNPELTEEQKNALVGLLESFRRSLTERHGFRFSPASLALVRLEMGRAILGARGEAEGTKDQVTSAHERYQRTVDGMPQPSGIAAEQIAPYVAAALEAAGSISDPKTRSKVVDEASATLAYFGAEP